MPASPYIPHDRLFLASEAIFDALVELMDGCDAGVANLTPFRGPSVDPGTAVEIGYLHARGTPVFGYTNVAADYAERVDDPDRSVEDFGLVDNLMVEGALAATGVEGLQVWRRARWRVRFGPVRAEDVPAWLAAGGQKTDAMRRVTF